MNQHTIKLYDALRIADEKERGEAPLPFAIEFVKEDGEIVSLSRAVKIGSRFNQKDLHMINVKQLDNSHHPYALHIKTIISFNGADVRI